MWLSRHLICSLIKQAAPCWGVQCATIPRFSRFPRRSRRRATLRVTLPKTLGTGDAIARCTRTSFRNCIQERMIREIYRDAKGHATVKKIILRYYIEKEIVNTHD